MAKVYKKSFELAKEIFEISKSFAKEEIYSLTDQIRRSSKSVCSCLAEAYRKKMYPAHFVSIISEAGMENSKTSVWLHFSFSCNYMNQSKYDSLRLLNIEVSKLLNHMIKNPGKY